MDVSLTVDSSNEPSSAYSASMLQPNGQAKDVHQQPTVDRNIVEELKAERDSLDPSFVHCLRWLEQGVLFISRV